MDFNEEWYNLTYPPEIPLTPISLNEKFNPFFEPDVMINDFCSLEHQSYEKNNHSSKINFTKNSSVPHLGNINNNVTFTGSYPSGLQERPLYSASRNDQVQARGTRTYKMLPVQNPNDIIVYPSPPIIPDRYSMPLTQQTSDVYRCRSSVHGLGLDRQLFPNFQPVIMDKPAALIPKPAPVLTTSLPTPFFGSATAGTVPQQPVVMEPTPISASSTESPKEAQGSEFVSKIFNFLNAEDTDKKLVRWSESGDSFVVVDQIEFARTSKKYISRSTHFIVLPVYFKHNNFASFIRQLNKYGFRKVKKNDTKVGSTSGGTPTISEWEFQHDLFRKGRRDLMVQIKRKKPAKADDEVQTGQQQQRTLSHMSITSINGSTQNISNSSPTIDTHALLTNLQHAFYLIQQLGKKLEDVTRDYEEFKDYVLRNFKITPFKASMDNIQSYSVSPSVGNNSQFFEKFQGEAESAQQGINDSFVPWKRTPRILLVDDDATCRLLGSKLLQLFNCSIDLATNGVEAVQKVMLTASYDRNNPSSIGQKYDLILMDIVMPLLDGVEATNQIRRLDKKVPIISMTSNTAEKDLSVYLSTGMNDVLGKPFSKLQVQNLLLRYLKHLMADKDSPANDEKLEYPDPSLTIMNGNASMESLSKTFQSIPFPQHVQSDTSLAKRFTGTSSMNLTPQISSVSVVSNFGIGISKTSFEDGLSAEEEKQDNANKRRFNDNSVTTLKTTNHSIGDDELGKPETGFPRKKSKC